jgi:hypothetical protein
MSKKYSVCEVNILKSLLLLGCVTFLALGNSYTAMAGRARPKVVYGEDNRKEPYQIEHALWRDLSKSTAAMVDISMLEQKDNAHGWVTSSEVKGLKDSPLRLCPSETFADQPFLATCSGFLVGEDLLVTAGHCVSGRMAQACNTFKWVFDYKVEAGANPLSFNFPEDSVYGCKEVLAKSFGDSTNPRMDYAIIRLDRKVVGYKPLVIRKSGKINNGEKLVIAGYPWGLPLKVSDGAQVVENAQSVFFGANLDSFQGNSGSAVFNQVTGEVEGILVRGRSDAFVTFSEADGIMCRKINRCSDDGKTCDVKGDQAQPMEGVTRITHLTSLIEQFKNN